MTALAAAAADPRRSWRIVWPVLVCMVFLQFTLLRVGALSVTLAPLWIVFFYLGFWSPRVSLAGIVVLGLVLFYPVLPASLYDGLYATGEFLKTYALWLINGFVIIVAAFGRIRPSEALSRTFYAIIVVLAVVVWGQAIAYRLTGIEEILNPFGPFYFGNWDPIRFANDRGDLRVMAGYLEPSYAARVLLTMLACCYLVDYRPGKATWMTAVALVPIASAGGAIGFVILSLIYWSGRSQLVYLSGLVILALLPVAAAAVVAFLDQLAQLPGVGYYVLRIMDIEDPTSSTYYRLMLGLLVLVNEIPQHWFGLPLGLVEDIVIKYTPPDGQVTITNDIYLLAYYGGVAAILPLVFGLLVLLRDLIARNVRRAVLIASLYLAFIISGTVFQLESTILLMFLFHHYAQGRLLQQLRAWRPPVGQPSPGPVPAATGAGA